MRRYDRWVVDIARMAATNGVWQLAIADSVLSPLAALAMRGLAILVGVELIERFHWIVYVLGATLLVLAWRILRGVEP